MSKVDRESAIGLVRENMQLSRFEAERFLDRLVEDSEAIKIEHDNITQDVACNSKRQTLAPSEIYPAFEALDDAWEPLGARYLASKKRELGQVGANRLQEWVNLKKRSITYVKFRHKEHWEYTKGNPNEALAAICRGFNVTEGGLSK